MNKKRPWIMCDCFHALFLNQSGAFLANPDGVVESVARMIGSGDAIGTKRKFGTKMILKKTRQRKTRWLGVAQENENLELEMVYLGAKACPKPYGFVA
jgi:hypothetical protein